MSDLQDLRAPAWREFTIEGGDRPVELVRLRRDDDGPGFTVLVRFPPGWSRPGLGYYDVIEEALFLDGEFEMSGTTYGAGDYAWLPSGFARRDSRAPNGALVLAWFSAPNRLLAEPPDDPDSAAADAIQRDWRTEDVVVTPFGPGRLLRQARQRSAWMVDDLDAGAPATADVELFSLAEHAWTFVAAGATLPDLRGPVYARARHPSVDPA